MTWRSISKKKTQARSNLRKRRSHCLVTHFGLRHAQKSTIQFTATSNTCTFGFFISKYINPTTNHTTSNLIGTTLIRTISTEKNGKPKKTRRSPLCKLRDQGSELAPKTLWGLDLSHFLLQSRNPRSHFCYKTLTKSANIKHPSFTLRQLDAVVGNLTCIVQME